LIGNLYGGHDFKKLHRTAKSLLIGALAVSLFVFAVYTLGASPIFTLLKVPAEIMGECRSLIWLYALSLPPTYVCSTCTSVLTGMGDSKTPMYISLGSQVLNIVLDVVVVAVFGWGIRGAALASLFSVAAAMLLTLIRLERFLKGLDTGNPPADFSCMRQYLPLAVPSILQQSVMSVGTLLLQVLVNRQGIAYINGYTVATTLNGLFLLPVSSCCMGYETFAAQNLGAGEHGRVRGGFLKLLGIGGLLSVLLSLLTALGADSLIGLYLTDSAGEAFTFARLFLLLLIPEYFLTLLKMSVESLFKAQMKVYLFTLSSLISLGSRILFAYALTPSFGLRALAWATVLGTFIAALYVWGMLGLNMFKERKRSQKGE
jgi:putative MATE family efflux protein